MNPNMTEYNEMDSWAVIFNQNQLQIPRLNLFVNKNQIMICMLEEDCNAGTIPEIFKMFAIFHFLRLKQSTTDAFNS